MDDSVDKFACPSCGQRVSATSDFIGSEATCPACATLFLVPAPPTTPQEKLAALTVEVNALGMAYEAAPDGTDDPEEQAVALETFLRASRALAQLFEQMLFVGDIAREPRRAEMHAIYSQLFQRILAGEWSDTEDDLKALRCLAKNDYYKFANPGRLRQVAAVTAPPDLLCRGFLLLVKLGHGPGKEVELFVTLVIARHYRLIR
jgi:hypothetical protein